MKETLYWYFAHSFGWTPQQVDEQYPDRLVCLKEMQEEFRKLEAESNKR